LKDEVLRIGFLFGLGLALWIWRERI